MKRGLLFRPRWTYLRPDYWWIAAKCAYQRVRYGVCELDQMDLNEYLLEILVRSLPLYKNDSPFMYVINSLEPVGTPEGEAAWDAKIDDLVSLGGKLIANQTVYSMCPTTHRYWERYFFEEVGKLIPDLYNI